MLWMFDPKLFHERYRIPAARLPGWDYADPGYYAVTIVTGDRVPWFGDVRNGIMGLSDIGCVIHQCWNEIRNHYRHVTTDEFVVMPDHVHGIVVIGDKTSTVETPLNGVSTNVSHKPHHNPEWKPASLGSIIQQFKRACTLRIKQMDHPNFSWQPRFYDHVIRTKKAGELDRIRTYIRQNPEVWERDEFRL